MIHLMNAEALLKIFSPDEAIDQVHISIDESGDTTTSDPQVQELLSKLYAASDAMHQDRIDNL